MSKVIKSLMLVSFMVLTACQSLDSDTSGYVTDSNQITGVVWRLDRVSRKGRLITPLKGHRPTLSFRKDGLVKGYSGLNKFFGRFVLSPDSRTISLGSGFGQEHNKGNNSLVKQESGYFTALKGEHEIYRSGGELYLNNQDKKVVLVFKDSE